MDLYYYTTTQTMQKILTNGNLFATNMNYMNDSEEYVNGLTEIKKLMTNAAIIKEWNKKNPGNQLELDRLKRCFTDRKLEEYKKNADGYSISFRVQKDLLSQWSMYARESGVSLNFSFAEEHPSKFSGHPASGGELQFLCSIKPQMLYYFTEGPMEIKSYKKTAIDILKHFFDNTDEKSDIYEDLESQWKIMSAYVKRYDFRQEAEYRLVFNLKDLQAAPRIDYRNDKNVLKPYLDITCENGWPINGITVGPGFNQEAVHRSIKHFLDNTAVRNGVLTECDYILRIKKYLEKLSCEGGLPEIIKEFRKKIDEKLRKNEGLLINQNEKRLWFNQLQAVVTEIQESKEISEKTKQLFYDEYFSVSGIILNKSRIPYIF